jgi:hypothetical protein
MLRLALSSPPKTPMAGSSGKGGRRAQGDSQCASEQDVTHHQSDAVALAVAFD